MQEINLKLLDVNQATQLRTYLQQHPGYGNFEIEEGTHDALGGNVATDKNVHIKTTNIEGLKKALDEHFTPMGHDWHEFQV